MPEITTIINAQITFIKNISDNEYSEIVDAKIRGDLEKANASTIKTFLGADDVIVSDVKIF